MKDKIADLLKRKLSGLFAKKLDAVLVVDLSSGLRLLNVEMRGEPAITALKIIELSGDKKEELIVSSIRDFIKENNLQHRNAILCPSLKPLFIKRLELPALPEAELLDALRWQIKDELGFEPAAAVLDYQIIGTKNKEDNAKTLEIICAVAETQEVTRQVNLLKQAGLACLAVKLPPFGYGRLIERYLKEEAQPCAIIDFQEESSYLAIAKNNKLDFYRDFPLSIKKLRESLSTPLVTDKGKVQLTFDEIREILFKSGVPLEGSTIPIGKMNAVQVLAMLRPSLERLTQEIKRSLAYYDAQFKAGAVKKILLAGRILRIVNLDKFLTKELGMEVSFIAIADKIKIADSIDRQGLAENLAVFGLALDLEKGINLLPPEFRAEKIERVQKVSLRWVAFIAFLLLLVSYIFARVNIGLHQKRLDNSLVQLNILSEVRQLKEKADAMNNFLAQFKNADYPVGALLKKISNIAGREVFLNDLNLNCEAKNGIINGFVKSKDANPDIILTKFVSDLNNSGYVADADIDAVEKGNQAGVVVTTFHINFRLP